ncbi:MAG: CocE/NonD family hydrolase, partial [Methanoregula sp.]|nr:CocE/NonD family hydrolase [Methanoregula sp.]
MKVLPVYSLFIIVLLLVSGCSTPSPSQAPVSSSLPLYTITTQKDWLTMSDGVKLSVTYFMPVSGNPGEKFPVLLEMDPYRKDDIAYLEDYPICSYFAKRGYVVAKVDVRGTGSSEGVLPTSEYTEQELSDGVEIINQLSRSAWSNGNVGMFGLSWSGFNSLMIAARKPPALKAILIAHGSDDLFYQDVHYIDGVIHMDCWEPMIDTSNALPATDEYAITSEYFANRFDQTPWHFVWKENQKDGPFWREKSVRFKPDIEIPVYLIGGLLDGYRDTIPRMMNSSNTRIKADLG